MSVARSSRDNALSQSTFSELVEINHETNRIIPVSRKKGWGIDLVLSNVVPLMDPGLSCASPNLTGVVSRLTLPQHMSNVLKAISAKLCSVLLCSRARM